MFTVVRGGCFTRNSSDFFMNRPNGLPYYLFLIIKSYSEIHIDDKIQTCKPNSVIIIKPNTPYSYTNPNGEYIDDWLHFNCTPEDITDITDINDDMLNHCFPISNPRLLTTYIQQILWENNFAKTSSREYYVDTLFKILVRHICDDFNNHNIIEYNPYHFKLQKLRLNIQAAPYNKYSAGDIATDLELSTSYFQALYKKFFGISFQADIINMRIDYAKELIISTAMPFEQIAYSCGYSSEVHFYRQFSAKTGMTPGEYRANYS